MLAGLLDFSKAHEFWGLKGIWHLQWQPWVAIFIWQRVSKGGL